jgi:hypothetical protein
MKADTGKIWFTAAELADARLPGLPASKRKVNERAARECWALKVDAAGLPLARPRNARGGGIEFHVSILPDAARHALVRRGIAVDAQTPVQAGAQAALTRDTLWRWYDGQSAKVKAEAERRAALLAQIDALESAGVTRTNAVASVSITAKVGRSTLWEWLSLVDGISTSDRLPHLAPRRKGGGREAEVPDDIWQIILSDYLRPERPPFSNCYWRGAQVAAEKGLSLPCEKTLKRRLEREIDGRLIVARRYGADALRQTLPAQQRSVAHLHAMEIVNIDGHKFDVFVRLPNGRIIRPVMVCIQDIFSRKPLAWRIGESESAVLTRLAFADLFRNWGIPKACVLDNGRAFASKWITGGAKTRFRFKIKAEEPTGILTALGIQTKWAMPYRGQSKPIERMFRDVASVVARHPAMSGAWTGNRPDAKPENYAETAVPFDFFVKLVDAIMVQMSARTGRRTEMAQVGGGVRSVDQVFADSYASAPIGRATPEQLRLALLTAEERPTDRRSGEIRLAGNRYWAPELGQIAGKRVTLRFDPDNLHSEVHVYNQAGQFLVTASLIEATGFDNMGAAKARAKQERDYARMVRELESQADLLAASAIAALLPDHAPEDAPEPTVIRPVRVRQRNGGAAAARAPEIAAEAPISTNFMDRFGAAVSHLRLVE